MKNTKTKTTLQKQHGTAVNKKYKDRLFRMIFNQKEELLELYNALNGTKYDDPQQLEINTGGLRGVHGKGEALCQTNANRRCGGASYHGMYCGGNPKGFFNQVSRGGKKSEYL